MSEITIARGLTRLKTIQSQLADIISKINKYGAWSSQKKIDYIADPKKKLTENHAEAIEEIKSLYQQFHDLSKLMVNIKIAIENANMETTIEICEKQFTIAEALIYKRSIEIFIRSLTQAYGSAVAKAERDVNANNTPILANSNYDEDKRKQLIAEILYLVPNEEIKKLDKFRVEFMSELDGRLNEVNAVTKITIPE